MGIVSADYRVVSRLLNGTLRPQRSSRRSGRLICMLHGGKFLQCVSERGGHGKVRRVVCIQLYDVGDRIFGDHPPLQRGGYRSIIRAKDEVSVDPFQSPFWDGYRGGERPK